MSRQKIFHITHLRNLDGIARSGIVWSDALCRRQGIGATVVGMSSIKERRLRLPVRCHAGTCVGDYVPFNFCPRSVMLYLIYKKNHLELDYREGQGPIVHLVADLHKVIEWAAENGRLWAFTSCNAGALYADFYSDLEDLEQLNWEAIGSRYFRDGAVKEAKQAEFLLHERFPWELVEKIGVIDGDIRNRVEAIQGDWHHRPPVTTTPEWYY